MHKLANLDLNLLHVLDALLQTQSVSAAANHIGRSQSAVSHALNRLRYHFGDPLLVRDGWHMRLTERGEQLRQPVRIAVERTSEAFGLETAFDPETSQRMIRLAARDIAAPLLTPLLSQIRNKAPRTSVTISEPTDVRSAIIDGNADVGLRFGVPASHATVNSIPITSIDWTVFGPPEHPYLKKPGDETWCNAHHVLVGEAGDDGPVSQVARKQGLKRSNLIFAPSFLAALHLASTCDAIFTTLHQPFKGIATQFGLIACPPPFAISPAPLVLLHQMDFGDPFRKWIAQICADIFPEKR